MGSLPWTFALALAGDAVAGHWKSVSSAFTVVTVIIGLIVVEAIVRWAVERRRSDAVDGAATRSS